MSAPLKIASLDQLDALVGRYIMDEKPEVYWEHTHSHCRFDTLDDALDALNDPFFSALVPEQQRAEVTVAEIREFTPYSADLSNAIKLVEQLGEERKPLVLCPGCRHWTASFGPGETVEAPSPALAICLAALRCRGIEVELARDLEAESRVA